MYRTGPVAALVLALALALASCGGGSSGDTTSAASPGGGQTVKATGKDKPGDGAAASTSSPDGATADACDARLGEFLARMNDLRQSLLAGLSYEEYVVRVRAIRDAYEAVPVERLGAACVTGPAADA
ncbi:MAG TPA: hypothetical protein VHZ54_18665, partial [Solirubrobacterales bacterium]|nr:hypothetical protein [Solirubrobacterales bacterium]